MKRVFWPWFLIAAAALLAVAGAVWWLILRAPAAEELLGYLPEGDGATLFVDFGSLRRAGILDLAGGTSAVEEPDYRRFVESAGFDYRRHLESAVLRFRERDVLIVAAGLFDLDKLASHVQANGGRCLRGLCTVQGSSPERQISFVSLRRGVLALAVGPDPLGASLMGTSGPRAPARTAHGPVWLYLPGARLKPSEGLPPGMSALLGALEGADHALFSLTVDRASISVSLQAPCHEAGKATAAADRLKHATEMLVKLLKRDNREPDPKDLSGVLAAGEFRADGVVVRGRWPLHKAFLDELAK